MRGRWAASLVLGSGLQISPVAAQPSPPLDPAAEETADAESDAERWFREGKSLYDAGDYASALDQLQKSEVLEPTVRSMGLIAACHEKLGKLASAYRAYRVTADRARAGADEREDFARDRAQWLEPQLGGITIVAEDPAPDMSNTIDGVPVAAQTLWYVDAGQHQVVAQAPGRAPFRTTLDVADGARPVVEIPALEPAKSDSSPIVVERVRDAPSDVQTWIGWTGVGIGAVGLGLGGVFTGITLDQKSSLEEDPACPDACADADAVDSYNTMRIVTTTAFIAGAVFLAGGVTLLLTAPGADPNVASASVAFGPVEGGGQTHLVIRY